MEKYQPLQNYLDDNGQFSRFPGKRQKKKQTLMLQFLAAQFEVGRNYSEK